MPNCSHLALSFLMLSSQGISPQKGASRMCFRSSDAVKSSHFVTNESRESRSAVALSEEKMKLNRFITYVVL